jgi:hypothetical protein
MALYSSGKRPFPSFSDVASLEAAVGATGLHAFCAATKTWYYYEASGGAYTRNGTSVLNTAAGGDTRWIAESGDYHEGDFVVSGSITGLFEEIIKTATGSLSVAECSGTVISNYGQGAEMTLTLPTAQAGLIFLATVVTTGNALHYKADASDKIYLDGTALDDGDKVTLATPALANCASFICFLTGDGTHDWFCNPINGYWEDGGA